VAASGTLGQIIPPSIVLVLIGDIVGVSVGDLFMGAVIPRFVAGGPVHLHIDPFPGCVPRGRRPSRRKNWPPSPPGRVGGKRMGKALFPPLFLMVAVLGSIFAGIASPTEAAAVGAVGRPC
jgi:TRAP-type mannitol/chloroaromatic compound transport system permease large subunit